MRRILVAAFFSLLFLALPAAAQTFSGAMSGSWWDASRPGEGQFITFESVGGRNVAYLAYFTYTADGRATWHVGNIDYTPGASSLSIPLVTGSGARFGAAFSAADVRVTDAGTATLEFVSCSRMRLRHTGIPGATLELTRLVGPLAGAGCGETAPAANSLTGVVSGHWWNAGRGGEGLFITFETVGARNTAYVAYFTYTADGAATWLVGNTDLPVGVRTVNVPLVTGSGARFGSAFRAQDVVVASSGSVTLDFISCATLRLTYAGSQSFTHDLSRLVGPVNGKPCTDTPVTGTPQGNEVRTDSYTSAHTGFSYPITLYFPPGYVAGSAPHPVIYAADSELQFNLIAAIVRNRGYNAIVVGVGHGGSDRRFVDYELPGSTPYQHFLTLELMPYIETRYRVDRTRRTFVGYSLSGSLAGILMFSEDPANRRFSSYVSVDAAFWRQPQLVALLEQAYFSASPSLPVTLFLASADNRTSIANFRSLVESRNYQNLRLRETVYQFNHAAVLAPGLEDGFAFVFGGN